MKQEQQEAKYGLPQNVHYCTQCVMSNQRPNSALESTHKKNTKKETIDFDNDGVCVACTYHEEKEKNIDWDQREKNLKKLCDRFRKNDGRYDCIIPGSGGKDSSYTTYVLKHEYGMHPLTVTWSPLIYTDTGWKNFRSWCRDFDNILYTPQIDIRRLLTKLAFNNLCHPFQPFMLARKFIGPRDALFRKIPLIFGGESPSEYGNRKNDHESSHMNLNLFTKIACFSLD